MNVVPEVPVTEPASWESVYRPLPARRILVGTGSDLCTTGYGNTFQPTLSNLSFSSGHLQNHPFLWSPEASAYGTSYWKQKERCQSHKLSSRLTNLCAWTVYCLSAGSHCCASGSQTSKSSHLQKPDFYPCSFFLLRLLISIFCIILNATKFPVLQFSLPKAKDTFLSWGPTPAQCTPPTNLLALLPLRISSALQECRITHFHRSNKQRSSQSHASSAQNK